MSKSNVDLPLEAATADIIARYKRGNDMLASAAIALRKLKERIDAGEAGAEWDWVAYRTMHLEPHITKRWINVQLQLAPPGATEAEVGQNVARRREIDRDAHKVSRERHRSHVTQSPDPQPGVAAVSAEGESSPLPHAPTLIATPHDDREGGDSVVTWLDQARLDPFRVEDFVTAPDDGLQGHFQDSVPRRLSDEELSSKLASLRPPHEGMVALWVDPHNPMSVFATGLMMAMNGVRDGGLGLAEAAADWPENMALLTNDLHDFADWLIEFEAAYRAQHGNGNAAALKAEATQ